MAIASIKQWRINTLPITGLKIQFDSTIGLGENSMRTERAGWVLVGGRSSRMGKDKAWLDTGPGPLAVQVAMLLEQVCGTVTLVGDPVRYTELGYPVIPDRLTGTGPLGGLEAALAASKAEWNLVVACDMPSLDTDILETLFSEAVGFDAAVPRHPNGKIEPLCAVYNARCHAAIAAALNDGIRKVTDALRPFAVRYVQTGREGAFANLNTPEDVRKHQNG